MRWRATGGHFTFATVARSVALRNSGSDSRPSCSFEASEIQASRVPHVRQKFSVTAHLASRCSANSYSIQLNEQTIGTMVLAERNSENVRNGRRSRGPSPNAQTESSSEEDGGITYFHLIAIDTRCPDYRLL